MHTGLAFMPCCKTSCYHQVKPAFVSRGRRKLSTVVDLLLFLFFILNSENSVLFQKGKRSFTSNGCTSVNCAGASLLSNVFTGIDQCNPKLINMQH